MRIPAKTTCRQQTGDVQPHRRASRFEASRIRIGLAFLLPALLLLTLFPAVMQARPHAAGPYLVEVNAVNQSWYPILDARVRVRLAKGKIFVQAHATGYLPCAKELVAPGGSAVLNVDLVMPDRKKEITIMDLNGETIESAYLQADQFGVSPLKYGLRVYIPRLNWPEPSIEGVEIFDRRWRPIDSQSSIEEFGEFYKVTFLIPRGELDASMREWYIVVGTELEPSKPCLQNWLSRLGSQPACVNEGMTDTQRPRFARFLAQVFRNPLARLSESADVPEDLKTFLAARCRFDRLHRNPQER